MQRSVGTKARAGFTVLGLALATLALTAGLMPAKVQAQDGAEIQALLDQGLNLFKMGRLDEAKVQFEKALLQDITSQVALEWVDKVGLAEVISMVRSQHEDIGKQITTIMNLTALEARQRERDGDQIAEKLTAYFSATDPQVATSTIYRSVTQHGVYLMPGLVERLGAQEVKTRVDAVLAIHKIDDDAVVPLLRVLQHDLPQVVLGAISALERIGHPAALPSLKRLAETTTDGVVRGAALNAMKAMDASGLAVEARAYDLLVGQAGEFYRNPAYLRRSYHDSVVWRLEGGALIYEEVPDWRVNELTAELFVGDALALDPNAPPARILNVCNKFAQYAEYSNVLLVAERQGEESRKTELMAQALEFDRVRMNYPYSQPAAILAGALARAMEEGRPEVAVEAITALRGAVTEGSSATEIDEPLLQALYYSHRGVRFAAAECIAVMNPAERFTGSEKVIQNLNEGLTEAGGRVALTILANEDDALHMASLLRVAHVTTFNESDGASGVNRVRSFAAQDVVVVGTELPDMPTAEVIHRLRADSRTRNIPIFVLARDDEFTLAEQTYQDEARNVHVLNRSIEATRLRDEKLAPLWAEDTSERARGIEVAQRAATALRLLASRPTVFDLSQAEGALVTVLENRADPVRAEACLALGSLRTARAAPALVRICNDDTASPDLRVAALTALGDVLAGQGGEDPVREALENNMRSEDVRILRAASRSMGKIQPAF